MIDLRELKNKRETSMSACVNIYKVMCIQTDQEARIWQKNHQSGRLPELPSLEHQCRALLKRINKIKELFHEIPNLMIQTNPRLITLVMKANLMMFD